MAEATTELGSRWSVRGIVRAVAVGSVAWAIGAWLGYLVAHERPPESHRVDAPATSASAR